ncbi:MAG: threonine ammonia-lyase [Clostridia bacterium]|jgi:threonine dehydratase|nr:threonine ammonia-lyase [Clostridia bacterium]
MVSLQDVYQARENLTGIIHKTNLDLSHTFSEIAGNLVFLKTENLQKTGSFKIRGAYNHIVSLSPEERAKGVIAASAGNHAQGVAYGATRAGIPSTIVMPEGAPISKLIATQGYGAKVILHGNVYDDAYNKALEIQKEQGATFVHAFDNREVIAGQGTIGLEILDEVPDIDAILVPIGGGGLISGIAVAVKALKPGVKIIGVEAAEAACFKTSRGRGKLCNLEKAHTIADGIAVKCPGELTYNLVERYVDDIVTVSDGEIASTIMLLLERAKLVAEGAGATALAALIYKKTQLRNKKIAAVISGGNIDMNFISRIIEKGLVKTGRNVKLKAIITDKPGNLQQFLRIIAENKANVIAINHDRSKEEIPLDQAVVQIVLETQSSEHVNIIVKNLNNAGFLTEIDN